MSIYSMESWNRASANWPESAIPEPPVLPEANLIIREIRAVSYTHLDVYKRQIQQLCPRTDDIWLKFMAVKQRTPAVRIPYPQKIFFSQIRTQSKGLHYENVGQNKNDIAIHNVLSHYPECLDILRKDLLGGR